MECLRKSALFAGLSPWACSEILQYAKSRTFVRNEVLSVQGESIDKWFLILNGSVKLMQVSLEGNEVILWLIGSGDALGLHGDAFGSHHTSTARAAEKCQALVWDRKSIQLILANHSQIKANISGILTARLRELEERFCEVASVNVADRLGLLLQRLCKSIGTQGNGGTEIRIRQQELAQMMGATHFTISRILSKWADSGLVNPQRVGITVRDPDHLIDDLYRRERTLPLCRRA